MEIKIEGSQELLNELQKFISEQKEAVDFDEEYRQAVGFHMEATLVGLIAVLSPIIINYIRAFNQYKIAKLKIDNDKAKHDDKIRLEELKFLAKEGREWKRIEMKELDTLEKRKASEKKIDIKASKDQKKLDS